MTSTPPSRRPARRGYHHGDLRRALLEAALELLEEQGAGAVTVRGVARRAGVSPGAPFRHYGDRNALLNAIAEEGMRRLNAATREALLDAGEDPLAQLAACCVANVRFASEQRELFSVMNTPNGERSRDLDALCAENRRLLETVAANAIGPDADLRMATLALHALSYGLSRLVIEGHAESEGFDAGSVTRLAGDLTRLLARALSEDR